VYGFFTQSATRAAQDDDFAYPSITKPCDILHDPIVDGVGIAGLYFPDSRLYLFLR
jgi:hypothetical protein